MATEKLAEGGIPVVARDPGKTRNHDRRPLPAVLNQNHGSHSHGLSTLSKS